MWPFLRHLLLGVLFTGLAAGCQPAEKPRYRPAFYHWQTTLSLSAADSAYLSAAGCQQLYIKVLDIARDPATDAIAPYALLAVRDTARLAQWPVVPAIFIANSVFQQTDAATTDWLAQKTAQALRSVWTQFPPAGRKMTEVQFDCDWTATTRAAYFDFLQKMAAQLPGTALSATIRLHQYKFPKKTGVPPVQRGMLMLYNTGNIEDELETNSIFHPADAQRYLTGAPARYPLPLDLALPLFSWALVYRDGELWKIIPGDFTPTTPEAFTTTPGGYEVQTGTFQSGHFLRPGDRVRIERITPELLRAAAALAPQISLAPDAKWAFYHLDSAARRDFSPGLLRGIGE